MTTEQLLDKQFKEAYSTSELLTKHQTQYNDIMETRWVSATTTKDKKVIKLRYTPR